MKKFAGFLFSFPLISNCSSLVENDQDVPSACLEFIERLNIVPVKKMFEQQKAGGELKFLAVHGYALSFPGLEKLTYEEADEITEKKGYVVLDGTSDHILDDACAKYQVQAIKYAKQFNQLVLNDPNSNHESR
ncbi:hypothetical protein [Parasphingorhabdus sp.]|uniref:hypothetical protein n=1 Tax=Parasphingorhabdus sp. TaxID=2709688 RepID=UPI003D2E514C